MQTPTKRHHAEPVAPYTPESEDCRGQMAKLTSPELRDRLANSPRNIRWAVSCGSNRTPRTPLGASRSESSISTYGQTVSQPIFETSRDVIARTYLHTPVSSPQKHGLQPMCETNDSPGSLQYLSPASQALRARLQGEIDASFSPSHVQLPAQDFSLKPASADLPAQSQQRTGQTFQTTPSHRNHKRFNQEMEDDDDSTTDVDDDTSAMQCDRSRPTRALPRSKPLTQTRSLPLFDMQADF